MKLQHLDEPELDFGAGRHIDIRFGIMTYGPLDVTLPLAPRQIPLGIIGSTESVDGVRSWLEQCRAGIAAKPNKEDPTRPNKHPNLFAPFPGYSLDTGFRSTLLIDDALCRTLRKNDMTPISALRYRNDRISRAVDLFIEEIQYLAQNTPAKVIICAVPLPVLDAIGPDEFDDEPGSTDESSEPAYDFHDMLKARAMQQYRKPIQLILPATYDDAKRRAQAKFGQQRELQDEATRAWNIHSALYYKADGVPWRLRQAKTDFATCYVGISFYRSLDQQLLLTSVAQVFNERGEGVVVRGGNATMSKEDRQVHLPLDHAHRLLKDALGAYWEVHHHYPARLVIHKSSRFNQEETEGFVAALQERNIATHDFLAIANSGTKLYRAGVYPPLRGTLLTLNDDTSVLYTRGSVPFFETYPGKYIPVPLRIRSERAEQPQHVLAREVLALTKMNWNNTQFDGAEPVTLRASRQCSNVLRYCSETRQIEPRYSYYM